MISPHDRDLITEGSETRRKFMDAVIAQSNKTFLDALIQYNRALAQRNALLKYFAANRTFDASMLELYDDQLCQWAPIIHEARAAFVADFEPRLQHYYRWMAGDGESVGIAFKSPSDRILHARRPGRTPLQRPRRPIHLSRPTPRGPRLHPARPAPPARGPQGQKNPTSWPSNWPSLTPSRTPCSSSPSCFWTTSSTSSMPSVEGLIRLVNEHHFGQIFITDTHPERTAHMVKEVNEEAKVLDLSPTQS